MNMNLNLIGLTSDITTIVHVGKLETLLCFEIGELSFDSQKQILDILKAHVENMSTSDLLTKLAK